MNTSKQGQTALAGSYVASPDEDKDESKKEAQKK
jgi:hypothetical protein